MRDSLSSALQQVLAAAVADGSVPGAVAIVVDSYGTQGVAAAGTTRVDGTGVELRTDATFRLASMTKALATVAALQLVDADRSGSTTRSARSCRRGTSCRCSTAGMVTGHGCVRRPRRPPSGSC